MRHQFERKTLDAARLDRIMEAVEIARGYAAQSLVLTVRQLYYQLVSKGRIENTIRSYKNTVGLLRDARMLGFMDWDHIEDRGRSTDWPGHWDGPAEILRDCVRQFTIDTWADQPVHIEVMVEKDALSGVLSPTCRARDVRLTANKGYSSISAFYEIGRRLYEKHNDHAKDLVVLYLGDHDPSGMDMTRDVEDRLHTFAELDPGTIEVRRLALNMDQVTEYGPPENPAKETDSRAAQYIKQFGHSSWELDALDARVLASLVDEAITEYESARIREVTQKKLAGMRQQLEEFEAQARKKWKS